MNSNTNTNGNNGFMGGFVLGILVGAAMVFLLATKKGKKLLKILAEEGVEGISELEELLAENILVEKPKPLKTKPLKVEKNDTEDLIQEEVISPRDSEEEITQEVSSAPKVVSSPGIRRRFFKGVPKRS